jgi:hypothetical protein
MYTEEEIAAIDESCHDGDVLVLRERGDYGDTYRAIWCDEQSTKAHGGDDDERWVENGNDDPMILRNHVRHARSIHRLGAEIKATDK